LALSLPEVRPANTDVKGRTHENIESRMDHFDSEARDRIAYFRERLEDMVALSRRKIPDDPMGMIEEFSSLASDINKALVLITRDKKAFDELNEAYKGRLLSDIGVDSPGNIGAKILSLTDEMDELRGKFFGRLISGYVISHLGSEIKRVEELGKKYEDAEDKSSPAGITFLESERYDDVRFYIAYDLAKALFSRYMVMLDSAKTKGGLTKDIKDSIADDIISSCRKRIAAYARDNPGEEGYSKKDVSEALDVLREALGQKLGAVHGDPEDSMRKGRILLDRFESLPFGLRSILEEYLTSRKTPNEEFQEIAGYVMGAAPGNDIDKILLSLERSEKAVSGVKLDTGFLTKKMKETYGRSDIEALSKVDIKLWNFFRGNRDVQKIYGKELLEKFGRTVRDSVFTEVLTKPGYRHEGLQIGEKATFFRDPRAIAYNVMNIWRASQNHASIEKGLHYVNSLTEEDVSSTSVLGIPGISEIIERMRQDPDFSIGDREVKGFLLDACGHMIRAGTAPEQYFASSLVSDMKILYNASEAEYERIVGSLSDSMVLDEQARSNFMRHAPKFLERLNIRYTGREGGFSPGFMQDYKKDIEMLSRFFDETEDRVRSSPNLGVIEDEISSMMDNAISSDDLERATAYAKEYLKALDDPKTAKSFSWLEPAKKDSIRALAMNSYQADPGLLVSLLRKVIDKERAVPKIRLISEGIEMLKENDELIGYIKSALETQPGSGYTLLTGLCLAKPVLDDRFYESLSDMFDVSGRLEDYGVPGETAAIIVEKGLSDDMDILHYCKMMSIKGKPPSKLKKIIKTKDQIARIEAELEKNPDNKTQLNMLHDRKKKLHSMVSGIGSMIEGYKKDSCGRALQAITGESQEVRDVDENLINAILTYHNIAQNRSLLSGLLRDYMNGEPLKAYEDDRNLEALERYSEMGINTEKWLRGIKRTYAPDKVADVIEKKKEQISFQVSEAIRIYSALGMSVGKEEIFERYDELAGMEGVTENSRAELRAHLDNIKSLDKATYGSKSGKVTIYVEQDPLMVLQMGNVVSGSCLGLGRGNTFATVANAVDANKRVIYAVMNGSIIGRKLIALNDQGQLVQYRTYNERLDLNVEELFERYLNDFGKAIGSELGNGGNVSQIISERWYNDGIVPFGEVARPSGRRGVPYSRTG